MPTLQEEWDNAKPNENIGLQKENENISLQKEWDEAKPDITEQGLGTKLSKRISDIGEAWSPTSPSTPEQQFVDNLTVGVPLNRPLLRTAGAIGGGVADIVGAGASKLYQEYVHPDTKKLVSDIGTAAAPYMKKVAEPVMSAYGKFKELLPETAKDLESAVNATALLPVGFGAKAVAKETVATAGDIVGGIAKSKAPELIRKTTSKEIKEEFPKIFKMLPSLQKDYRKSKEFLDKADASMYDIIKNEHPDFPIKGKGAEPLSNYAENLTIQKKKTWDDIEGMINKAGVDTPIDQSRFVGELAKRLESVGASSGTEMEQKAALAMIEKLKANPKITLGDAQKELQVLNERFKGAIPYDVAGGAKIDNMYLDFLKKSINESVESLPDNAGFKDLKKLWGSHREVEESVVKTLNQSLGKSQRINFIDIGSAAAAVSSLLSSNPLMLISVGAAQTLNIARRISSDMGRKLVKLSDRVKKLQAAETKAGQPFQPKSIAGKILTPQKPLSTGNAEIPKINTPVPKPPIREIKPQLREISSSSMWEGETTKGVKVSTGSKELTEKLLNDIENKTGVFAAKKQNMGDK